MVDVVVGQTASFTVTAYNAANQPIPDTGRTIVCAPQGGSIASVTCNPDGTGGVFTASAVPGPANFLAGDGNINSALYTFNVVPDPATTVTSLVITSP